MRIHDVDDSTCKKPFHQNSWFHTKALVNHGLGKISRIIRPLALTLQIWSKKRSLLPIRPTVQPFSLTPKSKFLYPDLVMLSSWPETEQFCPFTNNSLVSARLFHHRAILYTVLNCTFDHLVVFSQKDPPWNLILKIVSDLMRWFQAEEIEVSQQVILRVSYIKRPYATCEENPKTNPSFRVGSVSQTRPGHVDGQELQIQLGQRQGIVTFESGASDLLFSTLFINTFFLNTRFSMFMFFFLKLQFPPAWVVLFRNQIWIPNQFFSGIQRHLHHIILPYAQFAQFKRFAIFQSFAS